MQTFFKNLFFLAAFTFSVSIFATGTPGVESVNLPENEASIENSFEKVDYKDVQDVFRKVKRVDNILAPKKKLRKKKYTIA